MICERGGSGAEEVDSRQSRQRRDLRLKVEKEALEEKSNQSRQGRDLRVRKLRSRRETKPLEIPSRLRVNGRGWRSIIRRQGSVMTLTGSVNRRATRDRRRRSLA